MKNQKRVNPSERKWMEISKFVFLFELWQGTRLKLKTGIGTETEALIFFSSKRWKFKANKIKWEKLWLFFQNSNKVPWLTLAKAIFFFFGCCFRFFFVEFFNEMDTRAEWMLILVASFLCKYLMRKNGRNFH